MKKLYVNYTERKAQLKIQEMIFMLLAVVFFFILIGLFMLSVKLKQLNKQASQLDEEKAASMLLSIANLPEFSCPDKALCVDTDKLMALNLSIYENFFELKKLYFVILYPNTSNVLCTMANYPNCSIFIVVDKGQETNDKATFVKLCRQEKESGYYYEKCAFGKIIVGV